MYNCSILCIVYKIKIIVNIVIKEKVHLVIKTYVIISVLIQMLLPCSIILHNAYIIQKVTSKISIIQILKYSKFISLNIMKI